MVVVGEVSWGGWGGGGGVGGWGRRKVGGWVDRLGRWVVKGGGRGRWG